MTGDVGGMTGVAVIGCGVTGGDWVDDWGVTGDAGGLRVDDIQVFNSAGVDSSSGCIFCM